MEMEKKHLSCFNRCNKKEYNQIVSHTLLLFQHVQIWLLCHLERKYILKLIKEELNGQLN